LYERVKRMTNAIGSLRPRIDASRRMISNGNAILPFSTNSSTRGPVRSIAAPTSFTLHARSFAHSAQHGSRFLERRALLRLDQHGAGRADRYVGGRAGDPQHRIGPGTHLARDAEQ
jgi:hypothetical protein